MAYVQKFYVYDTAVREGNEIGGIRVQKDDDGLHVKASPSWAQYFIDQGMMGMLPQSKLKEPQKKMIAQVTRGRFTNPDEMPKRVARYTKLSQSGMPRFALQEQLSAKRKAKRRGADPRKDRTPQPKPAQEPPRSMPTPKPGHAVT
jgi:hypothetical protein